MGIGTGEPKSIMRTVRPTIHKTTVIQSSLSSDHIRCPHLRVSFHRLLTIYRTTTMRCVRVPLGAARRTKYVPLGRSTVSTVTAWRCPTVASSA